MAFPIYLNPRCFDAPFFSDSDAVYLASPERIVRFLSEDLGCHVETTGAEANADPSIAAGLIYVVARKP
jgi:hypothetical protein